MDVLFTIIHLKNAGFWAKLKWVQQIFPLVRRTKSGGIPMPQGQYNFVLLVIVFVLAAAVIGLIALYTVMRKKRESEAATDPLTGIGRAHV